MMALPVSAAAAAPRALKCIIACAQMTSTNDAAANFAIIERIAREAAAAGAKMLFLPECANYMSASRADSLAVSEDLNGPCIARFKSLSRDLNLWISLAGWHETSPVSGRVYNSHVVIDATGSPVAVYRKLHLFDLKYSDELALRESETVTPGVEVVCVDTPAGRLGLTTCYDLRFPPLYAALVRAGVDIIAVPSAFTLPTGCAHWEVLLRSRAIECQCYIVAAAQAGRHSSSRVSWGHACVVDPWGAVIAQCHDGMMGDAAGAVLATVDHSYTALVRARMPVAAHVRPEVYDHSPIIVTTAAATAATPPLA